MEVKKWECRLQCPSKVSEHSVKVNPNKIPIPEKSIVKITSKNNIQSCVFAKITAFDKDLKYGLSIDIDLEKAFNFVHNEEVEVELVTEEDCEIQMVELTCADQYVSRGDMWDFKENLVGSCIYKKKHIDFSWITVQVYALYDNTYEETGDEIQSGYITENTHFTYRSLSSYTQLFIQIGKEMWENDYEGMENWENFEKVVYQFVKTLFKRWEENKANHDLQIIFFTRLLFEKDQYPDYKKHMIQFNGDGRPYLDIYDIVCDGGNITDVKPIIGIMKRRFRKLTIVIDKLDCPVAVSDSSHGNFLECINLALDHYNNHFQDRVHYRTGQQIVVVTAGSGTFHVDRELASFTKHRVLDMGVGADVVCLGSKPLHATPLFVFQEQQLRKVDKYTQVPRMFDRYQVPHWMNMHFYKMADQPDKFTPIMGLSFDCHQNDRIEAFNGPAPSFIEFVNGSSFTIKQLSQLCDKYDSSLVWKPLSQSVSSSLECTAEDPNIPNSFSSADAEMASSIGTLPAMERRRGTSTNTVLESNPFRPSSLPRPKTNSRRRWAHAFPSSKYPKKNLFGLSRSLQVEQSKYREHVDWLSLIAPACFPTTTDYYPDTRYINNECKEHPYILTSLDIKQLQREIVHQRISRGFQIVLQNSSSKKNSLTVSMGDTYHDIKLQDNYSSGGTINVKISKPDKKAGFPESLKIYKYCLVPYLGKLDDIDGSLIDCQSERTTREAMVDAKWNQFDMYIVRLIDNDLCGDDERPRFDESYASPLSPWKSRYVFVPRPDYYFSDHNVNKLSQPDKIKLISHNFYQILFAMNNIKHQDTDYGDPRRGSLYISAPGCGSAPNSPSSVFTADQEPPRPRTGTLVDAKSFSFSTGSSEEETSNLESSSNNKTSMFRIFKSKTIDMTLDSNDLRDFKDKMLDPLCSMKFISSQHKPSISGYVTQPNLPPHTFLASSLMDFVKRNREDCTSPKRALEFCQELLRQKIIEETEPEDLKQTPIFLDGFYFYTVRPDKSPKERPTTKVLFEVATPEVPCRVDNFIPITATAVDIQTSTTDRREFFTVDYDSCYDPQHSFGLTVQWDRATAQLIEMCYLSKWRSRAEKAGFQLVQVPLNPFDSPRAGQTAHKMPPCVSPFRAPIDISLPTTDVGCVQDMLYQFGFLQDFPAGEFAADKVKELEYRKHDYVHLSGIALIRVSILEDHSVLKFASNPFLGSKKWHPKIFLPDNSKEKGFYQMSFEELLCRFRKHVDDFHVTS